MSGLARALLGFSLFCFTLAAFGRALQAIAFGDWLEAALSLGFASVFATGLYIIIAKRRG